MSVKFLGDWLIIASPHHDENSGAWTVVAEVSRRFEPTETFPTQASAEEFGLGFAEHWINRTVKFLSQPDHRS
jgi:hypothetical protein